MRSVTEEEAAGAEVFELLLSRIDGLMVLAHVDFVHLGEGLLPDLDQILVRCHTSELNRELVSQSKVRPNYRTPCCA